MENVQELGELEGKDRNDDQEVQEVQEGDEKDLKKGEQIKVNEEDEDLGGGEPSAQERFQESLQLQKEKRYRESRSSLEDLLNDSDVEISEHLRLQGLSMLARLKYWLGDYKAAEKAAHEVIKGGMECCQELAYEILARIAVDQFDFQLAEQYERKLAPSSTTRSLIRCFINLRKGNVKGAEATLNALSLVIDTKDPEYQLYRAMLDILKGNARSALAVVRNLRDSDTLNPSFLMLLAEVFVEAGSPAEASACLGDLEVLSPAHPGISAVKAQLFFRKERYSEAKQHAQQALTSNPADQKSRALLVRLQIRSGNEANAERTAHQMNADAPDYHESQAALADVYYSQERFTEARQMYEESFLWASRDSVHGRFRKARIAIIDEEYEKASQLLENLISHPYYQLFVQEDLKICYESMEEEGRCTELTQGRALLVFFERKQEGVIQLLVSSR
jgi:tetratricopeptide (TPR) repeat protein